MCIYKNVPSYHYSSPTHFGHSCEYDKNTVSIQTVVQKCIIKSFTNPFDIFKGILWSNFLVKIQ